MKKRQDKTTSYINKVSEEIIQALENGTAPWIKPWSGSDIQDGAPFNPLTGKQYEGINFINLTLRGMGMNGDPRWMTFKQAQSLDAQVRKGQKGTAIQYWKFTKQIDKVDEEGNRILDKDNKPIKETIRLTNPQVFYATVFNASQIDGLRPLKDDLNLKEVITEFEPIEAAEKILKNSQADITHVAGSKAFYSPSRDKIQLPLKEQFSSEMDYYSIALHELGHWTGHESRLNRDMGHPFGSIGYAKEELRAEIGSYMLSSKIGVDFDPSQHNAYIENWVSVLKDKPSEIFKACSDASKIVGFVTKLQEEKHQLEEQKDKPITNNEFINFSSEKEKKDKLLDNQREWTQLNIELEQAIKKSNQTDDDAAIEYLSNEIRELREEINDNTKMYEKISKGIIDDFETKHETVKEKELFSNIIEGAVTQMIEKELELDQLERALPTLSKNIEVEQLKFAIIKTQDILLHHQQIDEPVQEEIKELISILTDIHDKLEQEHQQKIKENNLAQEQKVNNKIIQNDKELKKEINQKQPIYEANTYLIVPYSEKDQAKKVGAKWDKKEKSWYAPKGLPISNFIQWSIASQEQKAITATAPSEQDASSSFKEAIEAQGLILNDEPIMDGKIKRVPVIGDKQGKKSGAYVGYTDGVPAGFIQNHKTGTKENWKAIGYEFSNGVTKEDLERQKLLNQTKRLERQKEQDADHEAAAIEAQEEFKNVKDANNEHPYLKEKEVKSYHLKIDERGNLLMPLQDIEGKHWTNQKINLNFKGFNKDGKKEGNFFIIGDKNLDQTKELIVVEGYATGATIHESTNKTVIVAVDSGNLVSVMSQLNKRYPNSTILLAGDDDIQKEMEGKENKGLTKAIEATKDIQRTFVMPKFTPEEIKLNATDFNDLAKYRGQKEVKNIIDKALTKAALLESKQKVFQKNQNQEHQKMHKREVVRKTSQGISR